MAEPWTAELVIQRLEEAGGVLMRLRVPNVGPAGFRSSMPEPVPELYDYPTVDAQQRPDQPTSREVTRMDQALSWVGLIPDDQTKLRRIVGARCLISWRTERHVFSFRRISRLLGVDHKTVQAWHARGIDLIVSRLNRPGFCEAGGGRVGPSAAKLAQAMRQLQARRELV